MIVHRNTQLVDAPRYRTSVAILVVVASRTRHGGDFSRKPQNFRLLQPIDGVLFVSRRIFEWLRFDYQWWVDYGQCVKWVKRPPPSYLMCARVAHTDICWRYDWTTTKTTTTRTMGRRRRGGISFESVDLYILLRTHTRNMAWCHTIILEILFT